jgi:hypothetical protein
MKKYPPRSIFISYNHDESRNIAGRIYERLASRLTPEAVFKDDENATRRLGFDFRTTFEAALKDCRVVLVVIDPGWYERRLFSEKQGDDMPPDWVRIEVESALNTPGLAVIPLMVDGADFPKNKPLPATITNLRYRDGKRVPSDEGFGPSMDDLVRHLEALLLIKTSNRPSRLAMSLGARLVVTMLLLLGVWGLFWMTKSNTLSTDTQTSVVRSERTAQESAEKTAIENKLISTPRPIRLLTIDGDEITPLTRVEATAHRVFSPEYGMSLHMLLDNQGLELPGTFSAEFHLSEDLRPKRVVAGGTKIENDRTGMTWKWDSPIFPGKLDKGQAEKTRGYALMTPFCPIDEATPMGPDLPAVFKILDSNGSVLAEAQFLVKVQAEMLPKQRIEYQTMDAQESPAGWYLDGQLGGPLRLGDATLMFPFSLTWIQKYKNVGITTDQAVTTVVLLPEALKPPKSNNSRRLVWSEKSGLPWAWWSSWLIGAQTEFRTGAATFEIDEELIDGFEAGYYHFRVINVLASDAMSFLDGKLQKPPLFDKYYTVFLPKPDPIRPRPARPVLEIVAPTNTGWPNVRATAFAQSPAFPFYKHGAALPLKFKNIGQKTIDISKLAAAFYLPDGTVFDQTLLQGTPDRSPSLRTVEKGRYPLGDTSFTLISGEWIAIGSGQITPGAEVTLNTGLYLGAPDSLPSATQPKIDKIIGVKIFQKAADTSGEDVLLYTGVINLNLEWHETWSQADHNNLLNQ